MKKLLFIFGCVSFISMQSCNDDKKSTDSTSTTTATEEKKADGDKKADDIDASQVPAAVKTAFAAKYAAAADVKWETATEDGKSTYKAKWKEGETKRKAEFGVDGSFIKED